MLEIKRLNVEEGSICRIWTKPTPNDAGEFSDYRVWGNRIDAEENELWPNINITGATELEPIDFVLTGSSGFYTLVDVVFGAANGASVTVFNQILTQGDDGEWYQHGVIEPRKLTPTIDNALKWVTVAVSMKNDVQGGAA